MSNHDRPLDAGIPLQSSHGPHLTLHTPPVHVHIFSRAKVWPSAHSQPPRLAQDHQAHKAYTRPPWEYDHLPQEGMTPSLLEPGPRRFRTPQAASTGTDDGPASDACPVLTLATVRPDARTTTWCELLLEMEGWFSLPDRRRLRTTRSSLKDIVFPRNAGHVS